MGSVLETKNYCQPGTSKRSFTNDTCVRSIYENGGVPVILPLVNQPEILDSALNFCSGLLFPGGVDVDPELYNETPHQNHGASNCNHELDLNWLYAANFAIKNNLPMLGICRGMQLLNVAFHGTLYQDLSERQALHPEVNELLHLQTCERDKTTHNVKIKKNTQLYKIFNQEILQTNTMHHQAVRDLGDGLKVAARCEADGTVEAIETKSSDLLIAVQWHPEDLIYSTPIMNNLFKDLISRAASRLN
ncbi:MAG: gamma-glutamyl-gamma-aminobutyrate hydrolase family protein [Synergistaceae bacterium]|nr:gamma-glutamyl-gamma-aminobutyrate hydrolase family protein [Synergistaceae bacterium]